METNPAEAQNRVAVRTRLRDLDVFGQKRALQCVDALLRVVRSHGLVGVDVALAAGDALGDTPVQRPDTYEGHRRNSGLGPGAAHR